VTARTTSVAGPRAVREDDAVPILSGAVSRWWDVAVIGVCATTAAIILVYDQGSAAAWGATASLAAVAAVYVVVGRRALARDGAAWVTHVAAVLLIMTGSFAVLFDPAAAITQAVLYPLLWVMSARTRTAVIRSAALVIGVGLASGLGTKDWGSVVVNSLLTFAFAVAFGYWITRIRRYGVERDQLLTELRAAQTEVAALERQAGVTEERARMAREIHDTIAQSLTGLVMTAQRASSQVVRAPEQVGPTIALIEDLATDALAEARALIDTYSPTGVSGGLSATLSSIADRFFAETGVMVTVSGDVPDIDRETELVLLRCTQEALANVRKHAHAQAVHITLDSTPDGAGVTVSDDGIGIGEHSGQGFGLAGMAERVRLVGGTVQVGPGAEAGTTVRVVVPRRDAEAALA